MAKITTNREFSCAQESLFIACDLGWTAVLENIDKFKKVRPWYTSENVNQQLVKVRRAEEIPTIQTRQEIISNLRLVVEGYRKSGVAKWRTLDRYISNHWKIKEEQNICLKAAGKEFAASASSGSWSAASSLLKQGNTFVGENMTALIDDNNMPEGFAEEFRRNKADYDTALKAYLAGGGNKAVTGNEKIVACNQIYKSLVDMCEDAQQVFKDDAVLKKQFTTAYFISQAKQRRVASVTGVVYMGEGDHKKLLTDVEVTLMSSKKTVVTNKKARYKLTQLVAGPDALLLRKTGCQNQTVPIDIKTGTATRYNVLMVAV